MTKNPKCNLCGISINEKLHTINRFKKPFDIVKCKNCNLVFINPLPNDKEIEEMYGKDYYEGNADYNYHDERLERRYFTFLHKRRIENIEKATKKKGKILDIGSSFGLFVKTAERMGWDSYGVEISKHSAEYAKEELGLKIMNTTLEGAAFPKNYFDVIHMAELIEHLSDPKGVLKECNRILKKNGLLVIQTSDADSLYAKIMGKNWDWFLPGHLYYFSRKTISKLLNLTKFKIYRSYYGDEFSVKEKVAALKKQHGRLPLIKLTKLLIVQTPRYLKFGSNAVGGMVIYAKKR